MKTKKTLYKKSSILILIILTIIIAGTFAYAKGGSSLGSGTNSKTNNNDSPENNIVINDKVQSVAEEYQSNKTKINIDENNFSKRTNESKTNYSNNLVTMPQINKTKENSNASTIKIIKKEEKISDMLSIRKRSEYLIEQLSRFDKMRSRQIINDTLNSISNGLNDKIYNTGILSNESFNTKIAIIFSDEYLIDEKENIIFQIESYKPVEKFNIIKSENINYDSNLSNLLDSLIN